MEWLTFNNILIALGVVDSVLGTIPNNWFKYRSVTLFVVKHLASMIRAAAAKADELETRPRVAGRAELRLLVVLLAVMVAGCGLQIVSPFDQECTVCEGKNSIICERLPNPCATYELLAVVAQEGVVLESYTVEQFETWVDDAMDVVRSGMTTADLEALIMGEIIKRFNAKVGGTVLVLSSSFLRFEGNEILKADDVILLDQAAEDLKKRVRRMAIFG